MIAPPNHALLTDYYQLTMLQAYYENNMFDTAVFDFFVRKLPAQRSFLMAAGLDQLLEFLQQLRFTSSELDWLATQQEFSQDFVDFLADLRFSGDVHAVAEGSIVFPDEPLVRVTASLPEAQLIESRLINILHFQTLIASKAARIKLIAPDKLLVDFGLRRAHGAEAGLMAARASFIAGFAGSATTEAGQLFDIPVFGTMAHSFIQAHDDESVAFEHFARSHPDNAVLLIDTYDTEMAAQKLVELAPALGRDGIRIKAVRLDSGDLAAHAMKVRSILDQGGLDDVGIFASGSLDESSVARLISARAPIDGFGIGTLMDTSADAPYLDCAYKLQEYAGRARRKRSEGKATWPGRKQVYRYYGENKRMHHDVLTLEADRPAHGEAQLHEVMRNGRRLLPGPALRDIRDHAMQQLEKLPPALRTITGHGNYEVIVSEALQALTRETDRLITASRT